MTATAKHRVSQLVLLLSLGYFAAGALLALWSPIPEGGDLHASYAAGAAVRRGLDPYDPADLATAAGSLEGPGGGHRFAYPPAWLPFCLLLSLMPWAVAVWVWKAVNACLLVGTVVLSHRLFDRRCSHPDAGGVRGRALLCFALALSPTITLFLLGQTTLLVVFAAVAAVWLLQRGRGIAAGLCLAVALTKPHLAGALLLFLLWRRRCRAAAAAIVASAVLSGIGLLVSGTTPADFVSALGTYSATAVNTPTHAQSVGLANLLASAFGAAPGLGRAAALGLGCLALGAVWRLDARTRERVPVEAFLPVLLLSGAAFLGAHPYDLVLVIPVFAWALAPASRGPWRTKIIAVSVLLLVPRTALYMAYDTVVSDRFPHLFGALVKPYRSWIVALLLVFSAAQLWRISTGGRCAPPPAGAAPAR